MRIYVASSWRNRDIALVVGALRESGHDVYDFRNPPSGSGFAWYQLSAGRPISPMALKVAYTDPITIAGFDADMEALRSCDACVLVMPAGISANLELGWAAGAGKITAVYCPDDAFYSDPFEIREESEARRYRFEPELMWKMADLFITKFEVLISTFQALALT